MRWRAPRANRVDDGPAADGLCVTGNFFRSLGGGVAPHDPPVLAGAALAALAAVAAAGYVPARRAAQIDPMAASRAASSRHARLPAFGLAVYNVRLAAAAVRFRETLRRVSA